eukprot:15471568-Alexandrium_andersonii.AAC.1
MDKWLNRFQEQLKEVALGVFGKQNRSMKRGGLLSQKSNKAIRKTAKVDRQRWLEAIVEEG